MSALSEARVRFIAERESLQSLADAVEEALRLRVRREGIACAVKGRVKDVSSFVGKSLRKEYADPWTQVTDKVGVRVTLDDPGDTARVVELIRATYEVIEYQDKTRALWDAEKVGYGGVHVQVSVPDGQHVGGECEIQVRSAAQNLWSEMSHRLLYKPGMEPDDATRRALIRLAALMEIFDEEVSRSVKQITAVPGYQIEELVNLAESVYYEYADNEFDRALSRFVLSQIGSVLPNVGVQAYGVALRDFAASNKVKLESIYRRYSSVQVSALIHQPESIVVFERIAGDAPTLRAEWEGRLPADELEQLRAIWGE